MTAGQSWRQAPALSVCAWLWMFQQPMLPKSCDPARVGFR